MPESFLIENTPFGTLEVRYYGIIIVVAMLIAASFAARLAARTRRDPDHVWGALTWAIIPGIIGARLWYVLFPPISLVEAGKDAAYYMQNFFDLTDGAIAVWSGGLHIFGALIGGLIGVWLYFSRFHNPVGFVSYIIFYPLIFVFDTIGWALEALWNRIRGEEVVPYSIPKYESDFPKDGMNMLPWLDIAGVCLPLAQAIGRWGNYINQELYGIPTNLPFGLSIDQSNRVQEYVNGVEYPFPGSPDEALFHPIFLYESIWNLIAFFVLANIYNNNRDNFRQGDFFLLYLAQYSFIRFFLEFLRIEQTLVSGINIAQVITAAVFVIALAVFFLRRNSAADAPYDTQELELAQEV